MHSYATPSSEKSIKETNLRKIETILATDKTDYEKAVEIRRIYPSSAAFKSAYFHLIKRDIYYEKKKDVINSVYKIIVSYENQGLFEVAKEEDKFKLAQADYKDTRDIINSYIEDPESYKLNDFLDKQNITLDNFKSAKTYIKKFSPELYEKFLVKEAENEDRKIIMPIVKISDIKLGIETGYTSTGEQFDIYKFWELNPFKVKDIDREMRNMGKLHPKFREMSYVNKSKNDLNGGHKTLNYADHFDTFVTILGFDPDHIIKQYMDDNNIKSCTLSCKEFLINNYETRYPEIDRNDVDNIIAYMDDEKIPYVIEVMDRLVSDYKFMKQASLVEDCPVKELRRSKVLTYTKGE